MVGGWWFAVQWDGSLSEGGPLRWLAGGGSLLGGGGIGIVLCGVGRSGGGKGAREGDPYSRRREVELRLG